jgi:serpin B
MRQALIRFGAAAMVMVLVAGSIGVCLGQDAKDDQKAVAYGGNEFAIELYQQLKAKDGNIFFSPYSISTALAMTYAGARNNTATEMAKVLRFNLPQEKLHPAFASLVNALNDGGKKGDYEMSVANALWIQKDYKLLDEFLALEKKHYGAGINEVNYAADAEGARKTINGWVEKQTKDRIKDLIQPGILSADTRLVLTNAIYFKGMWLVKFDKAKTREEKFFITADKTKAVPMMRMADDDETEFGYTDNDEVQVLELPYQGKTLSMLVMLPRKVDGLADVEKALTADKVAGWAQKVHPRKVKVTMPKFECTTSFSLAEALRAMGMKDAFDTSAADFSGITGAKDLFISAVIHKAFVKVDEYGTEAAAATAVIMTLGAGASMTPVFKADHPFLFVIRDNASGSMLFMGRVMEP